MLIAVDTSTAQVGLAIFNGMQILGEMTWMTRKHHTVELAPALSGLLARSSVSMDMVNALGVAIGPGSFTSLRVGLSFVKGLALGRRLPTLGIPTLDIIANGQAPAQNNLIVMIQAGRARIAYSEYQCRGNQWQAQGPVRSGNIDEILLGIQNPTIIAGEYTPEDLQKIKLNKNAQLASPSNCVRRPSILAELAWARREAGQSDDAASLAPIYLHVAGAPPA